VEKDGEPINPLVAEEAEGLSLPVAV